MRRNCNLELRLVPSSNLDNNHLHYHHRRSMMEETSSESPQQRGQQQLTIFYKGKVAVFDVTEMQARAIILLASQEMENRVRTPTGTEPASPHICSPTTIPMMKRSLQQFLQKRKHRIQATSPY